MARPISRLRLGDRFAKVGFVITLGLCAALIESLWSVNAIVERQSAEHGVGHGGTEHDRIIHDLDKQRKFRAERNMYLAGFSLALQFCIIRICQLMQESVEYEEEIKALTKAVANEGGITSSADDKDSKQQGGVEMTILKKKPQEKKKD
eukprot:CAMPEP_0194142166 /NCGR_PEP_ID=MMETSP0152-20130528/11495_1 /TAXON_ID=1049557 /ORGANISM="Thalassiothrix antarctica, Strain L6-D1" /LENGTH=148 /DNA_ID=CAMNT_0038841049 /DNA_START=223 /DNA_END=669 /DNA_ORIENTATION=+